MKLLLVTSSFSGGGITSYAKEFIRSFCQNYELYVIIGNDSQNPIDDDEVNVFKLEVEDYSIENAKKLIHLINEEIRPDVVVNSNAPLLSLVSPYINNDIKIIAISHSLRYDEADVAGFNSHYTDCVVALSLHGKKYLDSKYNISNKTKVIYNFVNDIDSLRNVRESKKYKKVLRIVYSGGTTAAKSPDIVCKIIKKLLKTDLKFEFYYVGVFSPTLKKIQPFKDIRILFPKDDRLKFLGRVPRDEALKIISSANIFLTPSRREGCPMSMLEAMRGGSIIITSDYPNACKEMIDNNRNGFVIQHNNIDAFVNIITDILENPSKYDQLYENSYRNYLTKFSFVPWKENMELMINDSRRTHYNRLIEFSEKDYLINVKKLRKIKTYNQYHMLIFETLKSAVPFFVEFLKKKINKNFKK